MTIGIFNNFKTPVLIDGLEIDTTLREVHTYRNTVTDYPIEDGANITDHIKKQPERLVIDSLTSNTPIIILNEEQNNLLRADGSNRIQLAYNTLLRWSGRVPPKQPGIEPEQNLDAAILTITTGLKVFTNMVIEDLNFPKDKSTGDAIKYTIQFKKIKLVEAEYSIVQKTSDLNGKAENINNQAAKTAEEGVQTPVEVVEPKKSLLLSAGLSAGKALGIFK